MVVIGIRGAMRQGLPRRGTPAACTCALDAELDESIFVQRLSRYAVQSHASPPFWLYRIATTALLQRGSSFPPHLRSLLVYISQP